MLRKLAWPSDARLRRLNWLLLVIIIGCNLYVLLMPVVPKVSFKVKRLINKPPVVLVEQPDSLAGISRDSNQLIMPTIGLTQPIFDGTDPRTVNKGIWRRPQSSTPDQQSNTVLVGHRFSYRNPAVLYLLDEVKVKDEVFVVWQHKIYAYQVTAVRIVAPNLLSIEAPTKMPRLTVYSCTPLWSTSHRLVVDAKLRKVI